jgi:hypothetical protein
MPKCSKCNHIYGEGEAHECPTPEYLAAHDALVSAAAEATEHFTEDELESATRDTDQP